MSKAIGEICPKHNVFVFSTPFVSIWFHPLQRMSFDQTMKSMFVIHFDTVLPPGEARICHGLAKD